jgi:5-formyltetrahydrofolate cyclo-ligase
MERKAEMREKMLKLLKSIKNYSSLDEKNEKIGIFLKNFIEEKNFKKIGVFSPQGWEVNLWNLWRSGLRNGWRLFFPKIDGKILSYIHVSNLDTELADGVFGIKEPVGKNKEDIENIDLFVFPGVAFSRNGVRIGRGRGYVDRTFFGKNGLMVGVCYHFQLFDFILRDPWDVKMNFVITEKGIFKSKEVWI